MSTELGILDVSFPAAEDLTLDQFKFVVLTSSGTVRRPDSETEGVLGILQNAPASGAAASVRVIGISKLEMCAIAAIGLFVKAEYVSATDAGKGKTAAGVLQYSRAVVIEAAAAEDDLASVLLIGQVPGITDIAVDSLIVTTDATAGALTYTGAQMKGGLILRDPAGGNRSDVTPTAADLVAAVPGAVAGTSFRLTIRNTADAAETITVTAGAGFTLSGTMTIAQNNSKQFLCRIDNVGAGAEAATLYSIGTLVH